MTESHAYIVLIAASAVVLVIWLFDLWLMLRLWSKPTQETFVHEIPELEPRVVIDRLLKSVIPISHVTDSSKNTLEVRRLGSSMSVRAEDYSGGTRLEIERDTSRITWVFRLLLSIFVLGIIPGTLAILVFVMVTFVIPNPEPGIRWQVVQMVQMIHVLWPPMLIAFMYRAMTNGERRVLTNLPLLITRVIE